MRQLSYEELVTLHLADIIKMCYAAEQDKWTVDQIDEWLRSHIA